MINGWNQNYVTHSLSASLSVLSDTTKDYLCYSNSCCSRPSRPRMMLSSCMFNLLRRTKYPMWWRERWIGKQREMKPHPQRLRSVTGEKQKKWFYFPPGLDERSVTLAYFYISMPPQRKSCVWESDKGRSERIPQPVAILLHSVRPPLKPPSLCSNSIRAAGLLSQYHIHKLDKSMQTSFG